MSSVTAWAASTIVEAVIGVVVKVIVMAVRAVSMMAARAGLSLRRMGIELVVDDNLCWTMGVRD